jgi:hypothetical protein
MKSLYILDENKLPQKSNHIEFAIFFSKPSNFIVEQTTIGIYYISTVFLGVDGLFETIVIQDEKIIMTERHHSWINAQERHSEIRQGIINDELR